MPDFKDGDISNKNQKNFEEWKLLFNAKLQSSLSLDKAIITLSAGAFALSITILQINPYNKSPFIKWLIISWLGFGVAIALTLISFLLSQKACDEQIETTKENKWSKITKCINYISISSFLFGIILFSIFTILSIN